METKNKSFNTSNNKSESAKENDSRITWDIPVTWSACGIVKIKANSLSEAMKFVKEDEDIIPIPSENDYVDGSFDLSFEEEDDVRALYNDGQLDVDTTHNNKMEAEVID